MYTLFFWCSFFSLFTSIFLWCFLYFLLGFRVFLFFSIVLDFICLSDLVARQCLNGSDSVVEFIVCSLYLWKDIVISRKFKDHSHRRSRLQTGTLSSWNQFYLSRLKLGNCLVRHTLCISDRHSDNIFLSVTLSLSNSNRNITSFCDTDSHFSFLVSQKHDSSKRELSSSGCNSRYSPHFQQNLFELFLLPTSTSCITSSHYTNEKIINNIYLALESSRSCSFSKLCNSSMIQITISIKDNIFTFFFESNLCKSFSCCECFFFFGSRQSSISCLTDYSSISSRDLCRDMTVWPIDDQSWKIWSFFCYRISSMLSSCITLVLSFCYFSSSTHCNQL